MVCGCYIDVLEQPSRGAFPNLPRGDFPAVSPTRRALSTVANELARMTSSYTSQRFNDDPAWCCYESEPLEHDPEKWKPVFRKDHAQKKG
jgi:hypothetical protein